MRTRNDVIVCATVVAIWVVGAAFIVLGSTTALALGRHVDVQPQHGARFAWPGVAARRPPPHRRGLPVVVALIGRCRKSEPWMLGNRFRGWATRTHLLPRTRIPADQL